MATVILVRHGRSTANASGVLAGRLPKVALDDVGVAQVAALGERLAQVRLAAILSSPQARCRQTASAVRAEQGEAAPPIVVENGVAECDYGTWQGQSLRTLAKDPLWKVVQTQPSAATFPGGESLRDMQTRAVEAVRRHDARVQAEVGADAVWLVATHGDIIKSLLADALGMHLDLFQRLHVDPASASVIRYTDTRPYVLASNTTAGSLAWLNPPPAKKTRRRASNDAAVGGGAGPGQP